MSTEFKSFQRKPFVVEAVKITEENILEIGPLVGEVKEKDGEQYIALDRRVVPSVRRAYVGWWITRMNDNLRCYSPKIFEEQFEASPEQSFTLTPPILSFSSASS